MIKEIHIQSSKNKEMIDITEEIASAIKNLDEGVITIFTPHTTSAITINENADPNVTKDLIMKFKKLSEDSNYKHIEGNSDAHLISSIVGASEQVIVKNSQLVLGTWQSIYFVDFDGPRHRKVILKY